MENGKKWVNKKENLSICDLDGKNPDEIIKFAEKLKEKYGEDCRIGFEASEEYESFYINLSVDYGRFETDIELKNRIDLEKRLKEQQEKRERDQYEKLKEKFEK